MRDDISTQSTSSSSMDELQALVILVEEEFVKEPLWGLPTSSAESWQQEDAPVQQLTPQARPGQMCSACVACHVGIQWMQHC